MWEIYDEYCKDLERQRLEEATKQAKGGKKSAQTAAAAAGTAASSRASSSATAAATSSREQWDEDGSVVQGFCILDRMVNQNTYADIAMDFKYWDDTSDAFRSAVSSH
eukprot:GHRR01036055.1.p1 GENE.GHRR01036055.1~~GHRR01036055.1.p1  ORF type:complete len:108 (-),score=51.04 GHRR01036055.1:399-722(-)